MCDHSICRVGREGIYIISKRSYIEWAQPIYRICDSKYIEKHLMKYHQVLFVRVVEMENCATYALSISLRAFFLDFAISR